MSNQSTFAVPKTAKHTGVASKLSFLDRYLTLWISPNISPPGGHRGTSGNRNKHIGSQVQICNRGSVHRDRYRHYSVRGGGMPGLLGKSPTAALGIA